MSRNRVLILLACTLAAAGLAAPAAEGKVKVTFAKRVLTVEGDSQKNRITVSCNALSQVKMNGRNPRGGPVACSRVAEVDVISGEGDDYINVRGVDGRFADARFQGFGTGTGVAVLAGSGDDRLIGSATAFNLFLGHEGNDLASGGRRRDILGGGADDDDLNGLGGRDNVLGKGGNDRLRGGDGKDLLSGNSGDDRLYGDAGADLLGGGPGRDKLRGGPGADVLHGGTGKDDLAGGAGKDEEHQG